MDDFYRPHHKAILKMIQLVVDNAHKAGKWAGICGELGADMDLTETFVRMGADELSVAPSMVLKLRKKVRKMRFLTVRNKCLILFWTESGNRKVYRDSAKSMAK